VYRYVYGGKHFLKRKVSTNVAISQHADLHIFLFLQLNMKYIARSKIKLI